MLTRLHSSSLSRPNTGVDPAARRRARRAVGAGLAAAALGVTATAAFGWGSSIACTSRTNVKAFSKWSDANDYFLAPNGGFESTTVDWLLSGGATVVAGNQPYAAGAKSLKVPFNGSAESHTMCVTRGENTIRLFVKDPHVNGAILHVEANVRSSTGAIAQTSFDVNSNVTTSTWSPTMILTIPNLLGGTGTQDLTVKFTTRGSSATWYLDDVYVDPFKST